jgi:hypothetical protein
VANSHSLRWTRAVVFVFLAILVTFLGAAAKHSQFEPAPHHGYLAKAVKMDGARSGLHVPAGIVAVAPAEGFSRPSFTSVACPPVQTDALYTPVSLALPPLRA